MALVDWSDPAAEPVLRLVCGLPPDRMAARRLMVLQAFIDDSTQSGEVTVLAGYLAGAGTWALFSKEWNELLSMRPPWKVFKTKNVMYNPSEITLERAVAYYRIIEKHVELGICIAIPHKMFFKLMDEFSCPEEWRNPYFMAFILLLSILENHLKPTLPDQTVDLIFDYQSESKKALAAWDVLTLGGKINIDFVRNPPIYKNDDDLPPLQAADLLAWHIRKMYADGKASETALENPFPWDMKPDGPFYMYSEANEDMMRRHIIRSLGLDLSYAQPLFVPGKSYLADSFYD